MTCSAASPQQAYPEECRHERDDDGSAGHQLDAHLLPAELACQERAEPGPEKRSCPHHQRREQPADRPQAIARGLLHRRKIVATSPTCRTSATVNAKAIVAA